MDFPAYSTRLWNASDTSMQRSYTLTTLAGQGTVYRFRLFVNHQEQEPCWPFGLTAALLPVPDRAACKAIALGKCRLGEAKTFPDRLDIDGLRDTDGMRLSPCGIALGIGQGILQPGEDTFTGCAHGCVVLHRCSRSPLQLVARYSCHAVIGCPVRFWQRRS